MSLMKSSTVKSCSSKNQFVAATSCPQKPRDERKRKTGSDPEPSCCKRPHLCCARGTFVDWMASSRYKNVFIIGGHCLALL